MKRQDDIWTIVEDGPWRRLWVKRGGWEPAYLEVMRQHGLNSVAVSLLDEPGDLSFVEDLPSLRGVSVILEHAHDLHALSGLPDL